MCMNEEMDDNETRSVTQFEKANPKIRAKCERPRAGSNRRQRLFRLTERQASLPLFFYAFSPPLRSLPARPIEDGLTRRPIKETPMPAASSAPSSDHWPELPYAAWQDTAQTLHLWTQIVGKIRLARTPWLNHSWHVTLYVTARGLTTSPIPDGARTFQIDFDFVDHVLWVRTSDGHFRQVVLKPMTGRGILRRRAARAGRARHRGRVSTARPTKSPMRSRSPRIACMRPTTATTPIASGASSARRTRCSRNSAPASSARRARCISSGAASISR